MTYEEKITVIKRMRGEDASLKEIADVLGVSCSTISKYLRQEGLQDVRNNRKAVAKRRLTQGQFIERARAVHGDVYDYSQVVYVNNSTKVRIVCPVHGVFEQTPHKHMDGRGCPHPDCIREKRERSTMQRFGVKNVMQSDIVKATYVENFREKHGCDNPMQCEEHRKHLEDSNYAKYGVKCTLELDTVKEKAYYTKSERGSLKHSLQEDFLFAELVKRFGKDDVVRQYRSDVYPFSCDLYIKSRDLYVEVNLYWTHQYHWFEESNIQDLQKLLDLKEHDSDHYHTVVHVWTDLDVRKRNAARKHNLNYVTFWNPNLSDMNRWLSLGCPDGRDWKEMYSWDKFDKC